MLKHLKSIDCYLYLVFNHMFGKYWTTEWGCLSPSSVGRSKLDRWERELAPTSTAASVMLFIISLLPEFLINKLSSSSYCFHCACAQHSVGKSLSATGRLVPCEYFSKPPVQTGQKQALPTPVRFRVGNALFCSLLLRSKLLSLNSNRKQFPLVPL